MSEMRALAALLLSDVEGSQKHRSRNGHSSAHKRARVTPRLEKFPASSRRGQLVPSCPSLHLIGPRSNPDSHRPGCATDWYIPCLVVLGKSRCDPGFLRLSACRDGSFTRHINHTIKWHGLRWTVPHLSGWISRRIGRPTGRNGGIPRLLTFYLSY